MIRTRTDLDARVVAPYLLMSFGLFWYSDTVADPDIWGHIRFGQDILRTGSIIQTDTYSYRTSGQIWINHEWLSEVIFAAIYDRAGARGLIIFKVVVSLLIVGLGYAHLCRRGLGPLRSLLLLIVLSLSLRGFLATLRPQMFTYILFLIQLLLLERTREGPPYRLWVLPILFAVWVNLHGGVLAGIGILWLWIAARIVHQLRGEATLPIRSLRVVTQLGLLGAACGLALLLNPYGAGLVRFLLRTATVPRLDISEWNPLLLMSLPGLYYLGLLVLGIFGLVGSSRPRRPEAVLLFGAAAIVPLLAVRHYPLFAMTLVVLAGEHIADAGERWLRPPWLCLGRSRAIAASSVVLALVLLFLSPRQLGCIRLDPRDFAFPFRAVALLKQSNIRGNLGVYFDWGEFALWHLGPGVKVSIDGRRETVYSDESYREWLDFQWGRGDWDKFLKTTTTDLVLVPRQMQTFNLLSQRDEWHRLYEDAMCGLFVRADLPIRGQLEGTAVPNLPANGGGQCFPGLRHMQQSGGR
jgi:hypothetical protein